MKKLILLTGIVLCCSAYVSSSFAQTQMEEKKMEKMKDGSVMMKNGKMMEMKDGNWVGLISDKTMTNGTKVMTDGTVVMKDGTKKTLANGDCVKPDGMMHKKSEKKM
ncbi:MAG: hypothetical protein JWO03_537 [Bacteroidetes bacterium]|nr:hypothetical protein [Bacteroidota bacterium]